MADWSRCHVRLDVNTRPLKIGLVEKTLAVSRLMDPMGDSSIPGQDSKVELHSPMPNVMYLSVIG